MKERIEGLIADLEFRRKEAYQEKRGNEGKKISTWHEGRSNELGFVITRLKAVLHETS